MQLLLLLLLLLLSLLADLSPSQLQLAAHGLTQDTRRVPYGRRQPG
jgi:hypothetical protein